MARRPIWPRPRSKAPRKSAAPFQCRLVVMLKVPAMGRVKTRLAQETGAVEALRFYRHTVQSVLGRAGRDRRWHTELSITPDTGVSNRFWPLGAARRRQGQGDLGQRMQRIMDEARPGPVIIIGTDIPAIHPNHIARAFTLLKGRDAVLGPAPDGGYWLAGLTRCPRIIKPFQNVRWSTEHARADTAANLKGLDLGMVTLLSDVDSRAELRDCQNWFGRRVLPFDVVHGSTISR